MSVGSRIVLTFLNMDVEYDEKWCGGAECTCDYVEICKAIEFHSISYDKSNASY